MSRRDEIIKVFEGLDANILTIVEPLIDEMVYLEEEMADLRTKPKIKYHPTDPSLQKVTPAGKLYKDDLAQYKDIVRILCSQLHKTGEGKSESPLREYLNRLETRR